MSKGNGTARLQAGEGEKRVTRPCAQLPDHVHSWPRDEAGWAQIRERETCGHLLLHQFVRSSNWVV
jgi:hypothetical protein